MIETRLTRAFDLDHPVVLAPMALASGGRLAAAVTAAGGLGLIGGAYCDPAWIEREFDAAGNARVGCGFITWKLAENPALLDRVLDRAPAAIFLSFGDPAPFAAKIKAADVPLICQVQTLRDGAHAAELGADIIVAQGAEAGGHGETRATFTLVPEMADLLGRRHPDTLLLAAGGVADGRGLAAALMLGADGALIGSRFWVSAESLAHPNMIRAAIAAGGDDTIRSKVMDLARGLDWPARYTARVLKNAFTAHWHDDLPGLAAVAETEAARWRAAWEAGDTEIANTFVGEGAGLIHDAPAAGKILARIAAEAETRLVSGWKRTP